jgi:hypothetical protein
VIFTDESLAATHDEISEWINWFAIEQKMSPVQIKSVIGQLRTFFNSGLVYSALKSGAAKLEVCDNCNGKGTLGVILAGEDGPRACSVCKGAGKFMVGVN